MTSHEAIGGYFGLELSAGRGHRYRDAARFQSARAAFLALLSAGRPRRVWMPWFVCNSIVQPLEMRDIDVARYAIDESCAIASDVQLGPHDWLFYVNYYGIGEAHVARVLERFPPAQVVIDNAQSFYSAPRDCLATLYSPRKFFGVPDGGYVVTPLAIDHRGPADEASLERAAHLLLRTARGAEAGYESFRAAENSLAGQEPRGMSRLTAALLGAIDYEHAAQRRRSNFALLDAALGEENAMKSALGPADVPLCYPFRTSRSGLRKILIDARVFVPTYWPELLEASGAVPALERELARSVLPIPCDQRYSSEDMHAVIDIIVQGEVRR